MCGSTKTYRLCFLSSTLAAALFLALATEGCKSDGSNAPNGAVATIVVNGFVKDYDGEPITGVVIIIKGSAPVTSAADGSFSVSNVTAPYDLSLIFGTQKAVIVYKGLTRSDPTLTYGSSMGSAKNAIISGTVPAAASKVTIVFFISGMKVWRSTANAITGAYTIGPVWYSSETTFAGTVYVLRYTPDANGLPTAYDAFGQKPLTITAGGTFANNNFAANELIDPPDQTIGGTTTRPTTAYQLLYRSLFLCFGNSYLPLASSSGTLSDNFSYNLPVISGATFGVNAAANLNVSSGMRTAFHYVSGIAGGTTNTAVSLLSPPQLNLPANNGTNIDTTTSFLWTAGGGTGVYLFNVYPTVANQPSYVIYTTATSMTIPNFSAQGLGLPANTGYTWYVMQYYPLASIDAAASPTYPLLIRGNAGDWGYGHSEVFNFTTRP